MLVHFAHRVLEAADGAFGDFVAVINSRSAPLANAVAFNIYQPCCNMQYPIVELDRASTQTPRSQFQ